MDNPVATVSYFPMLPVFLDCPFTDCNRHLWEIGFSVVFCLFSSTEKPLKMTAIKKTIQRHWQHWEIKHWTKTNKTQQRNLLFPNVASVKNGQSGLSILDCRHLYRFGQSVVFCLLKTNKTQQRNL